MAETWLSKDKAGNGVLLSLAADSVRVEIGPQYVELPCTAANLADTVTHSSYRPGRRDALGRIILPENHGLDDVTVAKLKRDPMGFVSEGETMTVVDHKQVHKPRAWKVYHKQDVDGTERFVKVAEYEDFEQATTRARAIAGGS